MTYVAPRTRLKGYTCPHCGVLAEMTHQERMWDLAGFSGSPDGNAVRTSTCRHCGKSQIWHFSELIYPVRGLAPPPNPEMPSTVLAAYEEAAKISGQSPRAAAALLRLAIQQLCAHLEAPGKTINDDIAFLVKKGLPELVQQSLDVVRVVGNNAVHPGVIDADNPETVARLFELVNVIVEYMIALPKRVSGLYLALPESARQGIDKRDNKQAG